VGTGPGKPKRARQTNWDRLRLLSFLDIASFHMSGEYLFLGAGLPIFLLLRFALASRLPTPEPTRKFIQVRVEKLLFPWVAWSLLFGAAGLVIGLRNGVSPRDMVDARMLLYGTTIHLWFLPFAAIVGIAVHYLDVWTQKVPTRLFLVACGLLGVAALAFAHLADVRGEPFRQWVFGLPAVPLGLMLGRTMARPWANVRLVWWAVLAACVAALGASLALRPAGAPLVTAEPIRYALALGLVAAGALLPNPPGRWIEKITPLLLGGYLLQEPLYTQTVMRLERVMGIQLSPVLLVLVSVPPTLWLVSILRRTRLRAIL
jgi:hypothetical protein